TTAVFDVAMNDPGSPGAISPGAGLAVELASRVLAAGERPAPPPPAALAPFPALPPLPPWAPSKVRAPGRAGAGAPGASWAVALPGAAAAVEAADVEIAAGGVAGVPPGSKDQMPRTVARPSPTPRAAPVQMLATPVLAPTPARTPTPVFAPMLAVAPTPVLVP